MDEGHWVPLAAASSTDPVVSAEALGSRGRPLSSPFLGGPLSMVLKLTRSSPQLRASEPGLGPACLPGKKGPVHASRSVAGGGLGSRCDPFPSPCQVLQTTRAYGRSKVRGSTPVPALPARGRLVWSCGVSGSTYSRCALRRSASRAPQPRALARSHSEAAGAHKDWRRGVPARQVASSGAGRARPRPPPLLPAAGNWHAAGDQPLKPPRPPTRHSPPRTAARTADPWPGRKAGVAWDRLRGSHWVPAV